ncbi:unnamed protein product [Phaedon cochleariae]|uniref:PPM-type phosphatase domain-containing protein n=1 Tax=Phaedon cochleariae TaxID=80249 RepID=A0A9N9SHR4_PHACE|nr:unnamed protein product [Phaedon cochleariae]
MPSLRKRVSSYFRQLSFHNEPREKKHNINENSFVTKYLQGQITLQEGPPIIYGKNPTDLPNYSLANYDTGPNTVIGCYSGPNGGLTTVKRTEKHLSVVDADIDYIDTHEEEIVSTKLPKKSPNKPSPGQPIDNTTMVIKVAGHEYCVTNKSKRHSKSHSVGSITDFNIEIETTKIDKSFYISNNNCTAVECKNNLALNGNQIECDENQTGKNGKKVAKEPHESSIRKDKAKNIPKRETAPRNSQKMNSQQQSSCKPESSNENYGLSKSNSEGNPFHHKKRGNIIKVERPVTNTRGEESAEKSTNPSINVDDSMLPEDWNKKSDFFYGLSDSLYDRNQVTKNNNGDPIADCFGIIARNDSAILAVADGVNWGEKASIAAKSAVHGCLHYLNKTIFNDTKPFENLTIKTDESSISSNVLDETTNLIANTREVFVCLLRAFNCAHDLILENKGMLTTLTVAVILPLKQKLERRTRLSNGMERRDSETQYICCVCNVGDTLAYVYSLKYGVRELTKGSHDINCNRDMRDALGALGPVDGINPELSNLTLSITTLQKGDIVMVASDGLTDNFDPNVCKFTVNSNNEPSKTRRPSISRPPKGVHSQMPLEIKPIVPKPVSSVASLPAPPLKPPRRSKNKDDFNRSSVERSSIKSNTISERSSSSTDNSSLHSRSNNTVIPVQHSDINSISKPVDGNESQSNECNLDDNEAGEPNGDSKRSDVEYDNPLIAAFMKENSVEGPPKIDKSFKKPVVVENKASSLRRQASSQLQHEGVHSSQKPMMAKPSQSKTLQSVDDKSSTSKKNEMGYKFLRSKTTLDIRATTSKQIIRNEDGIPYVTPIQRYELQLLMIEDILKNGISGKDSPCSSSKQLCENLVSYTISITSAKRHTLEDPDLYFDNRNGVLVEVSSHEKKIRRKKGLEKVQNLPGKLDHVTIVAYNVGNYAY